MNKITLKIDGMVCGMCEAHINDAVRRSFPVKKVTSSHGRGETVILSEGDLDEAVLRTVIDAAGYKVLSVERGTAEKKGLFGRLG